MKADIKKCPECNSDMYARVVKKGPLKGSDGWGCPLCFALYPEDESKNKNFFLYIKDEFMQGWEAKKHYNNTNLMQPRGKRRNMRRTSWMFE